jgi:chemotaxis protein methyltransferase CheR
MTTATAEKISGHATMPDGVYQKLCGFIFEQYGLKLGPGKKTLLEGRIRKRLAKLGIPSFKEYCDFLFSPKGIESETPLLADVVTTHKTDFFREPMHFEYLTRNVLPGLVKNGKPCREHLRAWSAGCSTGEEPYTLAMVLAEYAAANTGLDFSILATDISGVVIEKAWKGIYDQDDIEPIPTEIRKKYLMRGKDASSNLFRVAPSLRSRIVFRTLNFMDDAYGIDEDFTVIFCRNVLIYFDRITQERLINRFARHLKPGGYLFLGHSETISGLNTPFVYEAATIYRKV